MKDQHALMKVNINKINIKSLLRKEYKQFLIMVDKHKNNGIKARSGWKNCN